LQICQRRVRKRFNVTVERGDLCHVRLFAAGGIQRRRIGVDLHPELRPTLAAAVPFRPHAEPKHG